MALEKVQTRLTKPLAEHVARVVGEAGLYPTVSHYLQDLIRRDMERDDRVIYQQIVEGYRAFVDGRTIESTGNWKDDKARFEHRQDENWE